MSQSPNELLAAHVEAQQAKLQAEYAVAAKLGELVGQSIGIDGYPAWALVRTSSDTRLTAVPVYQLLQQKEERVPVKITAGRVDKVDLSRGVTVFHDNREDVAPGSIIGYTFQLNSIVQFHEIVNGDHA